MVPPALITILYVADLERAASFYDSVFDWRKSVDEPVYVEYEINSGARLGLMPQENTRHFLGDRLGSLTPQDGSPRAEIYVLVADLMPVIARLEAIGAECASPLASRPWGDTAAYYIDRDGYVVAVAQRAPA